MADIDRFEAIADIDVFDSMRFLLDTGVDLTDLRAVERVLINPYAGTEFGALFVDWCIASAKANRAKGGLQPIQSASGHVIGKSGFVVRCPRSDGNG